ncbi:E3 ubiquitin-protein ligase TRIM31-like [Leucoraja erinacea]|uniref:E3 ubiquitin-protein ligase TRIM31-like n=1 Tax=Leucoraja erinaceus TaxID=7782 RepID=UPI002455F21E|nr:E3 ubiquitin-protein ligase TRIM31-like [Leucoraja erinacea]
MTRSSHEQHAWPAMSTPGAVVLEESLACPVCLETFRDPVTLPCGHNFCLACISSCWEEERDEREGGDTEGGGALADGCRCPECRRQFSPRPPLARNILLCRIVEGMAGGSCRGEETGLVPNTSPGRPSSPLPSPTLPLHPLPAPCPTHGCNLHYCPINGAWVCGLGRGGLLAGGIITVEQEAAQIRGQVRQRLGEGERERQVTLGEMDKLQDSTQLFHGFHEGVRADVQRQLSALAALVMRLQREVGEAVGQEQRAGQLRAQSARQQLLHRCAYLTRHRQQLEALSGLSDPYQLVQEFHVVGESAYPRLELPPPVALAPDGRLAQLGARITALVNGVQGLARSVRQELGTTAGTDDELEQGWCELQPIPWGPLLLQETDMCQYGETDCQCLGRASAHSSHPSLSSRKRQQSAVTWPEVGAAGSEGAEEGGSSLGTSAGPPRKRTRLQEVARGCRGTCCSPTHPSQHHHQPQGPGGTAGAGGTTGAEAGGPELYAVLQASVVHPPLSPPCRARGPNGCSEGRSGAGSNNAATRGTEPRDFNGAGGEGVGTSVRPPGRLAGARRCPEARC